MEPRAETARGIDAARESDTEMKSETRERIQKGRVERMAGTIDGDFITGDFVSVCSEVSGVGVFCFVRWSVTLTAAGFYCLIRRTRNYTRSPMRERGCNS
jgi:hypothetical protein